MAALQNTDEPSRQPLYGGKRTSVQNPPANGVSPSPSNIPAPPPLPGTEIDNDDGEFEDDIRCYVLYDFQGKMQQILFNEICK